MLRSLVICLAALLLVVGCTKEDRGIGVVPLEGITLEGKIVESDESGVLLRTSGGRTAFLPDTWAYHQNGQVREPANLAPGQNVTAMARGESGRLVAASGKNVVLNSGEDTFALPVEALAPDAQQIPVQVQGSGGQTSTMPLQSAIYSPEHTVLSHPSYSGQNFPVADPYSVSRAYVVGRHQQAPLALVPTSNELQLVSLPPNHYPVESLRSNQPVRFAYHHDGVTVSSWEQLGHGEVNLSEVLLAGKLLGLLPGQAVVEVGAQPYVVPRNFLYVDNRPVAWDTLQPGSTVDIRYYPGVYQVADYNDDFLTLSYNGNLCQLPMSYLPNQFYQQPIAVRHRGEVKRLPFEQAKKLVGRSVGARIYTAQPARNWWRQFRQRHPQVSFGAHPGNKSGWVNAGDLWSVQGKHPKKQQVKYQASTSSPKRSRQHRRSALPEARQNAAPKHNKKHRQAERPAKPTSQGRHNAYRVPSQKGPSHQRRVSKENHQGKARGRDK